MRPSGKLMLARATLAAVVFGAALGGASGAPPEVRLVLQITVDQLRGDAVTRFGDRFGEGGFRHLLDNGIHYRNAHYAHANTETAPGHATLATGATPARHGIVANDWVDQHTGAFVYNTEDDRHHIIGATPRAHQGVSPRNLLASTFGDELAVHTAGRARTFSVSIKDRGAILPGGHRGKAFWFSRSRGTFVTSTYYYEDYPEWVQAWQARQLADSYKGKRWELLHDLETYVARDLDDRPFETSFDALGRTFPHSLGDGSSKFFYTVLSITPLGDELSLDFAKTVIDAENVGRGETVDYLQVSFSSPDYAGHLFGGASLEYEDAVLRVDRLLAELFRHVDRRVGLSRTLIVLSADHGGVEAPEHMANLVGLEVGRFPLDWFRKSNPLSDQLMARYGRDDLIAAHSHPYLYLDLDAIAEARLDVAEVERFVADEIVKFPGIAFAVTRSDLLAGAVADAPIPRMIRRSFHPQRSGHVHLVPEQYWFLHSTEEAEKLGVGNALAAIHGSPWRYDTYVPILFAGPGVPHAVVNRRVGPYDIAPTLCAYLGVKPPSGATGDPLVEVLAGDSELRRD